MKRRRLLCLPVLVLTVFGTIDRQAFAADAESSLRTLRRPIAIQSSSDDQFLYVANRRSGGLSIVDVEARKTVGEYPIGRQLADLRKLPDGRLLAVDQEAHELIVIATSGRDVEVQHRVDVAPYPVTVVVSDDNRFCTVASLWSRRLSFIDLSEERPRLDGQLDLPFAPRCQLLVKNCEKLIVADSHAAQLGIVDVDTRQMLHVRKFPGHNIRGLAVSVDGKMLLVAHQMLNELAHTVRNDVHWGLLMSNDLRWLKLDSVLSEEKDLYKGAHMHPLGQAGSATGDPAGLVVVDDGSVVVSLGGVGEIAIGREDDFSLQRRRVGDRPTGLAVSNDAKQVFVANTFSDSVSVVNLADSENIEEISLGPQPQLTLADRGELLFHNARLSHDSWMSCHSCHSDGHTNGLMNDNFSDASFGAPKRVLSLLGRSDTAPFAWTGSAPDIASQIRKSIVNTMQSDKPPKDEDVEAIAAYLATLQPPPSIDRVRGTYDSDAVARGQRTFGSLGCSKCHAAPRYTTPDTYDVHLTDKLGNNKFNPPSLLGVGQRGPYFHDCRAKTLEEVVLKFGHQLDSELETEDLADLLAFLRSL